MVVKLQEQSKAHEAAFVESVERLQSLREAFLVARPPVDLAEVGSDAHRALADEVRERGEWLA